MKLNSTLFKKKIYIYEKIEKDDVKKTNPAFKVRIRVY